jgi:hypothetical protein
MSYDGKLLTDRRFPITLYDGSMNAVSGITFNTIISRYFHENDTTISGYTVASGDWRELGRGKYTLNIGATEFNRSGLYEVEVYPSGSTAFKDHNFSVEVRSQYLSDITSAFVSGVLTPAAYSNHPAVTTSGFTGAALSQIVSSGNAANWNLSTAQCTGISPSAISSIIVSGNVAGWNAYSGIVNANISQISTDSVAADNLEAILDGSRATLYLNKLDISATSGYAMSLLSPATGIYISGTQCGVNVISSGTSLRLTSSGIDSANDHALELNSNQGAAFQINSDGQGLTINSYSAGIAVTSEASDAVYVDGNQTAVSLVGRNDNGLFINTDGNSPAISITSSSGVGLRVVVDNTVKAFDVKEINTLLSGVIVSGINPYSLNQIVTSGNAANWSDDIVTISGFTSAALSQIVASGNAANWSGVTDISTLATTTQLNTVQSNLSGVVVTNTSGVPRNLLTTVFDGSGVNQVNVSSLYKYTLAWIYGNITHTPSGTYYYNQYKDANGSGILTQLVSPSGRLRQ